MIYPCDNASIDKAVSILKNGGIIIYPTDTLYGFGVDATNSDSIDRLNTLKLRKLGWKVYKIWECKVNKQTQSLVKNLK